MSKFNYVWNENGDWEGLYDDGKLILEGHSIGVGDLAAYLGLNFHACEVSNQNTDMCGVFPESIDDLVGVNLGEWKHE